MGEKYLNEPKLQLLLLQLVITTYKAQYLTNFLYEIITWQLKFSVLTILGKILYYNNLLFLLWQKNLIMKQWNM